MEKLPARSQNHEAFFGPWRTMSEEERGSVKPEHIVDVKIKTTVGSETTVTIPKIPTRLYPIIRTT